MTEVTIRRYASGDFETLYRIDQICFPRGIAYGRSELRSYLEYPGAECFVAERAKEIAGYILTEASEGEAHIVTLDVLPDCRRARVGAKLLSQAEASLAKGRAAWIWLETATTNEPAIAFWQKHGYRQCGEILRGYYGRGGDAYQMRKSLRQAGP